MEENNLSKTEENETEYEKSFIERVIPSVAAVMLILAVLIFAISAFGYDESTPLGALRISLLSGGHPISSVLVRAEPAEEFSGKNAGLGLGAGDQIYKIIFAPPEENGEKKIYWIISRSGDEFSAAYFGGIPAE